MDVEVTDELELAGPVLLLNEEDPPFISQPYSGDELEAGRDLGAEYDVDVSVEAELDTYAITTKAPT